MSAAGRGGPRIEVDNYPTPPWCTRRILEVLPYFGSWIEPCAGEGAIADVVRGANPIARYQTCDIRKIGEQYVADATKPMRVLVSPFDLLITNPPFNVAHEIIQAQRDTARLCVYLLRSSFIAGERAEAYRDDMPAEYRLPERPEFVASLKCKGEPAHLGHDGIEVLACGWSVKLPIHEERPHSCPRCGGRVQVSTTDSTPYSWFVWDTQRRSVGSCVVLPSTPLAERKVKL